MKRFVMILFAVAGLIGGIGFASAQHSGSHTGGGAHASGQWHSGGGSWQGCQGFPTTRTPEVYLIAGWRS